MDVEQVGAIGKALQVDVGKVFFKLMGERSIIGRDPNQSLATFVCFAYIFAAI